MERVSVAASANRVEATSLLTSSFFILATIPGSAFAEVSDKEPTSGALWLAGLIVAVLCFAAASFRPWFGVAVIATFCLWCLSIILEIHSPDIMPHLIAEQGLGYYVQAYFAFGLPFCSTALGLMSNRRRTRLK